MWSDDEMRKHRERHADAMRRVREMNERLREIADDYVRMTALLAERCAE